MVRGVVQVSKDFLGNSKKASRNTLDKPYTKISNNNRRSEHRSKRMGAITPIARKEYLMQYIVRKTHVHCAVALLLAAGLMSGCVAPITSTTGSPTASVVPAESATATPVVTEAERSSTVTTITLSDMITIDGEGATVNGSDVLITAAGSYEISGTLSDGMIEVRAPGAIVELILNGVEITNADGPAILFAEIEHAIVTLLAGATNHISDGGANEAFDAALYSNNTLTIRGEGSLHVTGTYNEGISSTMHINFEGGTIWVRAVEDGVNANNDGVSQINIHGGYLYVETEIGDGVDSNGTINITGGTIITHGALVDMNGGLDADGPVTITGGTVIATGLRLSTPTPASTQKAVMVSFNSTQAAGTLVSIQAAGDTLLTFAPAIDFRTLLYSSAEIAEGVSYDVYVGGSASGDVVDGVYDGEYTPGELFTTVTTESVTNARNPWFGGPPRNAP